MRWRTPAALLLVGCSLACHPETVQRADLSFEPAIARPAFPVGEGPVVLIDEAHANYHTARGRYEPFARLLRRDGYVVRGLDETARPEALARSDVLVIANASTEEDDWKLPTPPAFTDDEIVAIRDWVDGGGALLLIADHMPMPGAAEELAGAFDILFHNGFLYDAQGESKLEFSRDSGLAAHPITDGRDESERVERVRTFTGQAFRVERPAEPLLLVSPGSRLRLPIEAWEFDEDTPSIPADGMLQGAAIRYGRGRVAVFGEAAMFTAQEQITGDERTVMGMNHPDAAENPQFLLNVLHWLSGELDPPAGPASAFEDPPEPGATAGPAAS